MHLGLVDLSQTPSGPFFPREVNPASEMGYTHRQNRLLLAVYDLAPKAQRTFLRKSGVRERIFFCISPAPEYLCGPCFKVITRTDHGNSAVLFSSVLNPI